MFAQSREAQIMFAAQQMADTWRRDQKRGAFDAAAVKASTTRNLEDHLTPREQRAFIAAADLARLGIGHAERNPGPMLRTIERHLLISDDDLSISAAIRSLV